MSENLLTYLRQRQGPVTAEELAAEVLKLRNVPATAAHTLIAALLSQEQGVDRIGEDTYIYRVHEAQSLAERGWLICSILPERANHWSEWQAAACTLLQDGKTQLIGKILSDDGPGWPQRIGSLLRSVGEQNPESTVILSGFGNQISLLQRASFDLLGARLPQSLLSMRTVASRLFPAAKIREGGQLSALFSMPFWSEADIDAMHGQCLLLWQNLLAAVAERGIASADELAGLVAMEATELDLSPYAFDEHFLERLPVSPGVYLMYDAGGTVIYVGKAKQLAQRVKSYFLPGVALDDKLAGIRSRLHRLEIMELGSELEALLLEQRLIQRYDPAINRQLRVRSRPHRRRNRYPRILILPSSDSNWLRLCFLDPLKGLVHYWLAREYEQAVEAPHCHAHWQEAGLFAPGTEVLLRSYSALEAALEAFWEHKAPIHDLAAAEIAWSWLGEQKESIHGIDMRLVASSAEGIRLVEQYRLGLGDWHEKIIFT